jgi:hypothetical protein
MKKWIVIATILIGASFSYAKQGGPFGMGIILGEPTGICAKYWLDRTNAIDGAIGFDDFSIHADYLWHFWDIFPKPSAGQFGAYVGPGLIFKDEDHHHDHDNHRDRDDDDDDDNEAGVRLTLGMLYETPRHPFEIFAELVPVLVLSPDADLELDGAIGVRFFF